MKILILGASGTVGKPLFQTLSGTGAHEVHGSYHRNKPADALAGRWHPLDISDVSGLTHILKNTAPDLVVSSLNCDFAQQLTLHRHLAQHLQKTGGRMVFVSTANVFDGDVRGQHREGDKPYPISSYGKFKQACETLLQETLGEKCLVIRLPKVIDEKTAESFLKQAETGAPPVYENLHMGFNSAQNVASAIAYCIEMGKTGVLHLTSIDAVSISQCMDWLLAQAGKNRGYTPERLTVESFCSALGCDDPGILRHNHDGEFHMDLVCTDPDIVTRFGITCEKSVEYLQG